MTKTIRILALGLVWTIGGAALVQAQAFAPAESQGFVNVSVGGEFQNHTFIDNSSFALFSELATVSDTQTVGRGIVFDVTAGYRVWRNLSVAIGVSTFNGSSDATLTGSIPSPLVFGQPKTSSTTATGLNQSDVAVNFQLVWIQPLSDKVDVAISLGPSLIHVSQDVASPTVAAGTQTITSTTTTESKSTGKAGNAGIDLSYKLTSRYGAGGFVRYVGGEVDLPSAPKLKVGGLQVGGGLRIRF
jgi:hypothetical protein